MQRKVFYSGNWEILDIEFPSELGTFGRKVLVKIYGRVEFNELKTSECEIFGEFFRRIFRRRLS